MGIRTINLWQEEIVDNTHCGFFSNIKPYLNSKKGKSMSTTYGRATVVFPGFSAITVDTVDQRILFAPFHWGYRQAHFLPQRNVRFSNGKKRRLSKKERSQLMTFSRKWNKHGEWDPATRRYQRRYRTLGEEEYG